MENASKALIMAATILISVIILSLGVFLFTYFGSYAKDVHEEIRDSQISKFNSQFLSYDGKIKPIYDEYGNFKKNVGGLTIYDVVSLANLAREYNKENELSSTDRGYITIDVSKVLGLSTYVTSESTAKKGEKNDDTNNVGQIPDNYKYDDENEFLPYSCKVEVDQDTLMVKSIIITQK